MIKSKTTKERVLLGKRMLIIFLGCVFIVGLIANFTKADDDKPIKLMEHDAILTACYLSGLYEYSLIDTTADYVDHFNDLEGAQPLIKLFNIGSGSSLHITAIYGWDPASLVYAGEKPEIYAINYNDNKPKSSFEKKVVKWSLGKENTDCNNLHKKNTNCNNFHVVENFPVAYTVEKDNYVVAVKLFVDTEMGKSDGGSSVLEGCIKCHQDILDKRPALWGNGEDIKVESKHLQGAVIFKIAKK